MFGNNLVPTMTVITYVLLDEVRMGALGLISCYLQLRLLRYKRKSTFNKEGPVQLDLHQTRQKEEWRKKLSWWKWNHIFQEHFKTSLLRKLLRPTCCPELKSEKTRLASVTAPLLLNWREWMLSASVQTCWVSGIWILDWRWKIYLETDTALNKTCISRPTAHPGYFV